MTGMSIELDAGRREFRPGEIVAGSVSWSTDTAPTAVEVRLFWITVGVAPQQVGLVKKTVFSRPAARDTRRFEFRLPVGPLSFRGHLAGLAWAVEAVMLPSRARIGASFEVTRDGGLRQLHPQDRLEESQAEAS